MGHQYGAQALQIDPHPRLSPLQGIHSCSCVAEWLGIHVLVWWMEGSVWWSTFVVWCGGWGEVYTPYSSPTNSSLFPLFSSFQLCDLYENDCIFDKFECTMNGDGSQLLTGSYHNYFHIYDKNGKNDVCIEASKYPTSLSLLPSSPLFSPSELPRLRVDSRSRNRRAPR